MGNSNLYIGEACGTCAHSDVCIHRVRGDNTIALHMAEEVEPNLPTPLRLDYSVRNINPTTKATTKI